MKCSKCGFDELAELRRESKEQIEKFKLENGDKPYFTLRDMLCGNCTAQVVSKLESQSPLPYFITAMYECGSIRKSEKAGEWTTEKPCPRDKPCRCLCACKKCNGGAA